MIDDSQLGPDWEPDPDARPAAYDVNAELPKSTPGGVIEAVKRAVVDGLREAIQGTSMHVSGKKIYVDLEYPQLETQYPGIWVQFSPTKLQRAGVSHELPIKENGNWCVIQEWQVEGRTTLSIVALHSIDRDRLADLVIGNLAFARPVDLVITRADQDTKQNRALIAALSSNPYIAMTVNTDVIYPGGQSMEVGVPWSTENVLAYVDSYSFDVLGNFNIKFTHDGIYELARIELDPHVLDHIDPRKSRRIDYIPDAGWRQFE